MVVRAAAKRKDESAREMERAKGEMCNCVFISQEFPTFQDRMKNVLRAGKHLPPPVTFLAIFWQSDDPESAWAVAGGRQQTGPLPWKAWNPLRPGRALRSTGRRRSRSPRAGPGAAERVGSGRCGPGRGQRRAGPPESRREPGQGDKGTRASRIGPTVTT